MEKRTLFLVAGNRGLGLEFVRQYLEAGWQVAATTRQLEEAQELAELSKKYWGCVRILKMDVLDEVSIERAKQMTASLFGSVDLVLYNAGVYGSSQPLEELSFGALQEAFEVNCGGAFRVARAFHSLLAKGVEKKFIVITSKMGSIADNESGGSFPYRISKAALNMFGKTLAVDWKREGITVGILHPGWVRTRMGGENAPLSKEVSVAGMREVIERLSLAESGSFLAYNGEEVPW